MALVNLNLDPDQKTLRQFGFIAFFAFGALGGWTLWRSSILGFELSPGTAQTVGGVLAGLGVLAGVLALVAPKAVKPLFVGMTLLTFPIGFVVSHVILALLYFVVITPIGLIMRLLGHDPMQRRLEPQAATYWVRKEPVTDVRAYFRQY